MIRFRPLLRLLAPVLLLAPALLLAGTATSQQEEARKLRPTEKTLEAWMAAALPPHRDLDQLKKLLDAEIVYRDPTAERWNARPSSGIEGRGKVLEHLGTSKVKGGKFEVLERFVAGEYAMLFGELELLQPAWTGEDDSPPVTTSSLAAYVLRIRGGKVVEWTRYLDRVGQLRAMAKHVPGLEQRIDEETQEQLEVTARAYLAAYADRNLKGMICRYGDSPRYWDPTADLFGMGEAIVGKDVIRATMSTMFAPVIDMKIEPTRTFFTDRTAVFLSRMEYTMVGSALGLKRASETFSMPTITVLRIEKGKVQDHIEYCDHEPVLAKLALLRAEDGREPFPRRPGDGLCFRR